MFQTGHHFQYILRRLPSQGHRPGGRGAFRLRGVQAPGAAGSHDAGRSPQRPGVGGLEQVMPSFSGYIMFHWIMYVYIGFNYQVICLVRDWLEVSFGMWNVN